MPHAPRRIVRVDAFDRQPAGVLVDQHAFAAAGIEHTRAAREARRATSGRRRALRCRWGSSSSPGSRARWYSPRAAYSPSRTTGELALMRSFVGLTCRSLRYRRSSPPPPPPPGGLAGVPAGGRRNPGRGAGSRLLRLPGRGGMFACGMHAGCGTVPGCGASARALPVWLLAHPGGIADASSSSGVAASSGRFVNGGGIDVSPASATAPGGRLKGRIMMRSNADAPATGVCRSATM